MSFTINKRGQLESLVDLKVNDEVVSARAIVRTIAGADALWLFEFYLPNGAIIAAQRVFASKDLAIKHASQAVAQGYTKCSDQPYTLNQM